MKKILIVDDDQDFSNAARIVLSHSGYEVFNELSASHALEKIQTVSPDLLILDVMFPENPSAGFEIARQVQESHPDLPILMLTAINEKFPLGFNKGNINENWLPIDSFLEKPVDFDVLKNKIEEMVKKTN